MRYNRIVWVLLISMILIVNSVNALEPKEIAGKNIISTHSENNIQADWYQIQNGYYIVSIQTLDGTKKDVSMNFFIDNAVPSVYDIIGFTTYKYDEKERTINDYRNDCEIISNANGTIDTLCTQIVTGTHKENYNVWEDMKIDDNYDKTFLNWITLGWLEKQKTKVKKPATEKINKEKQYYKVNFNSPITENEDGTFGNLGRVGVEIDGTVYHPIWITGYSKRKAILINNTMASIIMRENTTFQLQGLNDTFRACGIDCEKNLNAFAIACGDYEVDVNITDTSTTHIYETNFTAEFKCPAKEFAGNEQNVTYAYVYYDNNSGSVTPMRDSSLDKVYLMLDDLTSDSGLWYYKPASMSLAFTPQGMNVTTTSIGTGFVLQNFSYGGDNINISYQLTGFNQPDTTIRNPFRSCNQSLYSEGWFTLNHYVLTGLKYLYFGSIVKSSGDLGGINPTRKNTPHTLLILDNNISFYAPSGVLPSLTYVGRTYNLTENYCNGTGFASENGANILISNYKVLRQYPNGTDAYVYGAEEDAIFPPYHENPTITSTFGTNGTNENLTCTDQNQNGYGFAVKNITNWYLNNQSIILLNLPFEGGSNATYTKDYSGLNHNGNVSGAVYNSTGGYDLFGAYNFTDTKYISAGILDSMVLANNTYGGWIKMDSLTCSSTYCFPMGQPNNGWGGFYMITYGSTFYCYSGNDGKEITTTISDNTWTHIMCRHNDTKMCIYKNGVNSGCVASTVGGTNRNFQIGGSTELGQWFNGTIDDVMVFNRSLSDEQIKFIFENRTDMLSSEETEYNDVWSCNVTPVSSQGNGSNLGSGWLKTFSIGSPITLTPSINVNVTNSINASSQYVGTLGTIQFKWYNDSHNIFSQTYNNIPNSASVSSVLNSGNFTHFDNITASVLFTEGMTSETINSSNITISNSPPTVPQVISPANQTQTFVNEMILNCSGSTDADGDTIYYEYYNTTDWMFRNTSQAYNWTPLVPENYYWRCQANDTWDSSGYNTSATYFEIVNMSLEVCNIGSANTTLNITIKDELNSSFVNASLTGTMYYYLTNLTGTMYYYLTNGISNINKTLTINSPNNNTIPVCMNPFNYNITGISMFTYSAAGYPSRTTNKLIYLQNLSINQTVLYLLPSGSGIYTTFQVVNSAGQPIEGVSINEEKLIGGIYVSVESKNTDAAGGATFWVDYTQPYRYTFTKAGYTTYTTIITPTQPTYTITLSTIGAGTTTTINPSIGMTYAILPSNETLNNNTNYNFILQVNSSYYTLDLAGFRLRNNSNYLIGSASCAVSPSCTSTLLANTGNNSYIIMEYYWSVNSTYFNNSRTWYVVYSYEGDYSIIHIIREDIQNLGSGMNDFTKAIISLIIIVGVIGGLSYESGIYSPQAILLELFGLVLLLEAVGLFPQLVGAVPFFGSIITGLIAGGYFVYENWR
jgi:hypothetical protein